MKTQGRLTTILISGVIVTGMAIGVVATQAGAHAGTAAAAPGGAMHNMAGMNMIPMAGMRTMTVARSIPHANAATAARGAASAIAPEQINMVIVPDALRGSNKRNHDAFLPAYISAQAGQKVTVTVYNLDQSPHSFTAPALGLNVILPGGASDGSVRATTFTFTAPKAGAYTWKCVMPCDNGGVNAWAMTHMGFMAGTVIVH
ncbi:MAG TPA: cupredoxin domain-containing protein [Chloroflexota bacterium]|nr:cupredoxin domain-containing protein [Chloroflexota bacterium]